MKEKSKDKRQESKVKSSQAPMRIAMLMALLAGAAAAEEAKKTKVVQTPFGPSVRAEEGSREAALRVVKDDPMLKIEESGEVVTFKRRTPFGEQVWRRKRSELTDLEKEMMAARKQAEREHTAAPPAEPPSPHASRK